MQYANRSAQSAGAQSGGIWLVLHLTPKKRGSGEQQLEVLAERVCGRGTPLTYVFAGAPAPWLGRRLAGLGVEVRIIDYARPFVGALRLSREWARRRPALVHFHFVRSFSPLVAAARLAGARVVLNDHLVLRGDGDGLRAMLKQARGLLVNPMIEARVAVSDFVAESLTAAEHVSASRIRVIDNGVDVERFAAAAEDHDQRAAVRAELDIGDRRLVLSVSRLWREKGGETAIRALPLIGPDAVLAIVGDGPMEEPWRRLAGELGIGERVRFLGLRDDVERLLAAADVAVVPSDCEEAFGQAVAEAMAAGKPVVVTRSGAMPSVLGGTGLVVPRRDPTALAAAVRRLLDDARLATWLGEAAQRRAREHYDLPRWLDRTVALYDELLSH